MAAIASTHLSAAEAASSTYTPYISTTQQDSMQSALNEASEFMLQSDKSWTWMLQTFQLASSVLSSTGVVSLDVALPATPAAVNMMLEVFKACSEIQALGQQPLLAGVTQGKQGLAARQGMTRGAEALAWLANDNLSQSVKGLDMSTKAFCVLVEALKDEIPNMPSSPSVASELLMSS
jgi:hypothetical protein